MSLSRLALVTVVVLILPARAEAACTVSEAEEKFQLNDPGWSQTFTGTVVTLENENLSVATSAAGGGNIFRLVSKAGPTSVFHRLDDNFSNSGQWAAKPYTCRIDERGPDRVAVTVLGSGTFTPYRSTQPPAPPAPTDLTISRTLSLSASEHYVQVDVTIVNTGAAPATGLRYMAHTLYSYTYFPGGTFYVFLPGPNGIECFDYERLVKERNQAARVPANHPFRRWSAPDEKLDKARYPALGWAAMSAQSGRGYFSYDPKQFDYVGLWTGTHPAEWLTIEPNTTGVDLAPGKSVSFSYRLGCDAKDMPLPANTLVFDVPSVPSTVEPGTTVAIAVFCATVRDAPEPAAAVFTMSDAQGKVVLSERLEGQAGVLRFARICAPLCPPRNFKPGLYRWAMVSGAGAKLGDGMIEVAPPSSPPLPLIAFGNPPVALTNALGMELVMIPAGEFMMGSADDDPLANADEKPRHRVRITKAFLMGKYEVTNAQFRRFAPDHHSGLDQPAKQVVVDADTHPVLIIDAPDLAEAFCAWLNTADKDKLAGWTYRLPTEAEWEWAARGPNSLRYPWGNNWMWLHCNFGDLGDGWAGTAPVGSFGTRDSGYCGDSPFDVADMAGNVWEWCADFYREDFYGQSKVGHPDAAHGRGSRPRRPDRAAAADGARRRLGQHARQLPRRRPVRPGIWYAPTHLGIPRRPGERAVTRS
jgi:formylglycine-generating enzyme required for sulfatase activity